MHAGDVTPADTWAALADQPDAVLVDVRTEGEWTHIGTPDLSELGKEVVLLQWQRPDGSVNHDFVAELEAAGVDPDAPVYFLCRSGVRSAAAAGAATAAGFTDAHNVADGFEGPPDASGRRGTVAGWQASGLPWTRS